MNKRLERPFCSHQLIPEMGYTKAATASSVFLYSPRQDIKEPFADGSSIQTANDTVNTRINERLEMKRL